MFLISKVKQKPFYLFTSLEPLLDSEAFYFLLSIFLFYFFYLILSIFIPRTHFIKILKQN